MSTHKVSPGVHMYMTGVRLTIQGTLTKGILSDVILTPFSHHSDTTNGRNIDLWEGSVTVIANGREGMLTN